MTGRTCQTWNQTIWGSQGLWRLHGKSRRPHKRTRRLVREGKDKKDSHLEPNNRTTRCSAIHTFAVPRCRTAVLVTICSHRLAFLQLAPAFCIVKDALTFLIQRRCEHGNGCPPSKVHIVSCRGAGTAAARCMVAWMLACASSEL